MKAIAAITAETKPRIIAIPQVEQPNSGEILCRTLQLGICGTDRDILADAQPLTPPGDSHLILGHECLAEVVQTSDTDSGFHPGDLVVPTVRRHGSDVPHRLDLQTFGDYSERGIVHQHGFSPYYWSEVAENLVPVAPNLSDLAVLTEPVSVAEKGVNEAIVLQHARLGCAWWEQVPPRVLVTGLGPIAFGAALATLARSWPTTMCGRDEEGTFRPDLAESLGADYVQIRQLPSQVRDVETDGFDLILECTGSDEVLVASSSYLAARGVLVWLGSSRLSQPKLHDVESMMRHAVLRNHIHLGCVNSARRDFDDALQHLGWFALERPQAVRQLITGQVGMQDALWHYQNREPGGIKVVVEYPK